MKIVAGLGSIEEYPLYVAAGADELFCGYVPASWSEKYGTFSPLNRREVRFYNVQIGSLEDLKILKKLVGKYGVPVKIALNSLYYRQEQYAEILQIMKDCMEVGFDSFIIADPALLEYVREQGIRCQIHISGEMSEYNTPFLNLLGKYDIKRVIFHRKCTIPDMAACTSYGKSMSKGAIQEYEAFALNEMCYFTGAYCNSYHCDELCHLCHVPYRLGRLKEKHVSADLPGLGDQFLQTKVEELPQNQVLSDLFQSEDNSLTLGTEDAVNSEALHLPTKMEEMTAHENITEQSSYSGEILGESGCSLCALWKLREAGITHLKVVGRGNYSEEMERDIRGMKRALEILECSQGEEEYLHEMKRELFPHGCSKRCYYLGTSLH